jgi:hypothetical protein
MPKSRGSLPALVLVCCALGAACGSSSADAGDELDYELFFSTRTLKEADFAALESSDDAGTLVFSSESPALSGVDVGAVLLAGATPKTPNGLLRVVTGVERGPKLVVHTAAAPLEAAFKRLHLRARRLADPSAGDARFALTDARPLALRPRFSVASGKGERSQSYQIVVFDGDGDVGTTNDQIKIDATLGGGFNYALSVDVDWGDVDALPKAVVDCLVSVAKLAVGQRPSCRPEDLLPEVKSTFDVQPFVTLDVDARGAASIGFEKSIDVGTIYLPVIPLGPVLLTPTVDIIAKVKGGASARFEVGASARADIESSVTVSSRTSGTPQYAPPRLKDYKVTVHEPKVDLNASATAQVGARLNVSLYGVVGPYATASGVAQVDAAPLDNPCWKVRFAIETELGVRITTPRLPVVGYVTLADAHLAPFRPIDEEVARGACVVPPEPPRPPGSGPTTGALQTPSFKPWAKALSSAVDGAPSYTGSFLLGSPELVPSIDNRWIAVGGYAFGMHKLDGEGNLTWTSKLGPPDKRPLRAVRSVPTSDAGLLALLRPDDTAAFVLAKTGQSGALETARSYALPDDCVATTSHLMRDAGAGFLVLGRCNGGRGYVVHVDDRLDVIRARYWEDAGATNLSPVAGATSDGEVVLAGEVAYPSELEWTFVARLDADDRPSVTTAFKCPAQLIAQPSALVPSAGGGVTVVGTANGLGLVARVRKDGQLGFARYPNLGTGVAAALVGSSVAELPTTGMIMAASHRDVSTNDPPGVVLAGLDSGGTALWARRYALTSPAPRALALPALRLTDDGGAIVTMVAGPANGSEGDLYAMKVFAKDGTLGDGFPITSTSIQLGDYTCQTATRAFAPNVTDVPVTVKPIGIVRQ